MNNINAYQLAQYIKIKYKKLTKNNISPIKLQKSLYFLFAYWGAYIRKMKLHQKSIEHNDNINIKDYDILFQDKILAWTYGAIIESVIKMEMDKISFPKISYRKFLKDDVTKKEFIDNLLKSVFECGDFELVKIAQSDKCWKDNYLSNDIIHNKEIPKDDIINEYMNKEDI